MATSMEADSEVHFKEKREGKGVKTETAVDDATLQFEFRASTPAASPSGRGAERPERRNEGTNDRNEGTGNEKPFGLVQIVYRDLAYISTTTLSTSVRKISTCSGSVMSL